MNTKQINALSPKETWTKILASTIVTGLGMWIIAGAYHSMIAVAFYKAERHAEHEGIGLILLAYMILGFIMTYFHSLIFIQKKFLLQSILLGSFIGILWVFPHELAMAGAHGESISYVIKNGLWHIVEQGFGGMLVGIVLSYSLSFKKISQSG